MDGMTRRTEIGRTRTGSMSTSILFSLPGGSESRPGGGGGNKCSARTNRFCVCFRALWVQAGVTLFVSSFGFRWRASPSSLFARPLSPPTMDANAQLKALLSMSAPQQQQQSRRDDSSGLPPSLAALSLGGSPALPLPGGAAPPGSMPRPLPTQGVYDCASLEARASSTSRPIGYGAGMPQAAAPPGLGQPPGLSMGSMPPTAPQGADPLQSLLANMGGAPAALPGMGGLGHHASTHLPGMAPPQPTMHANALASNAMAGGLHGLNLPATRPPNAGGQAANTDINALMLLQQQQQQQLLRAQQQQAMAQQQLAAIAASSARHAAAAPPHVGLQHHAPPPAAPPPAAPPPAAPQAPAANPNAPTANPNAPTIPKIVELGKLAMAELQRLSAFPPSEAKLNKERELQTYIQQLETLYTQLVQQQRQQPLPTQPAQSAQPALPVGGGAQPGAPLPADDTAGGHPGQPQQPAAAPAPEKPPPPPPPPLEPRVIPPNPGSLLQQIHMQRELAARQHMHFRPGYQRSQQRHRSGRADVDALTATSLAAFEALQPPESDAQVRAALLERLEALVKTVSPDAMLYAFGSSVSGLASKGEQCPGLTTAWTHRGHTVGTAWTLRGHCVCVRARALVISPWRCAPCAPCARAVQALT